MILGAGALSLLLGLSTGALWYEPDPGGIFGHIGILAGIAAIAIGTAIVWLAGTQYPHRRRRIAAGHGDYAA